MLAATTQLDDTRWTLFPISQPEVIERILDLLLARANYLPGIDVDPDAVRALHRPRVSALVTAGRPIDLVLPAFPAKSPNREKTLGALPDYGEVLALRRLDDLCRSIDAFYAPGARITICSDGRVFGDLVRVSDDDIDAYGRAIDGIIAAYGFQHLRTFGLEHVFPELSGDGMRARLVGDYAVPVEEVREKVITRDDYRQLFNGIHRFLFEDGLVLDRDVSRNQTRLRTKALAYEVIQRSNAWSELVERYFSHAVRLSIHPQAALSMKIGIRLLPSDDVWRTPWHSVTLFDGIDYRLVPRKDAEARGAKLVIADGQHGYFELLGGKEVVL